MWDFLHKNLFSKHNLHCICGDGGNRTPVYMSKTYESTLCRTFSLRRISVFHTYAYKMNKMAHALVSNLAKE
ncbi:MAG: hypothetical protein RJB39_755 [Candidatus Parcubacteria bacterium]